MSLTRQPTKENTLLFKHLRWLQVFGLCKPTVATLKKAKENNNLEMHKVATDLGYCSHIKSYA